MLLLLGSGWLLILAISLYLASVWMAVAPGEDIVTPEEALFVLNNEPVESLRPHWDEVGDLFLPVELLSEHLDLELHWEGDGDQTPSKLIWTAREHLLEMRPGERVALLDGEPIDLIIPAKQVDEDYFIPADFVSVTTGIRFQTYDDTGRVVIEMPGDTSISGRTVESHEPRGSLWEALNAISRGRLNRSRGIYLRHANHPKADISLSLDPGDAIEILDSDTGWYRVMVRGVLGYLPASQVELDGIHVATRSPESSDDGLPLMTDWGAWRPGTPLDGQRVTLVWEHFRNTSPDFDSIGPMPGVNVISPTWFSLADTDGRFYSTADADYVEWARDRGFLIWGLATNSFDPDLTSAVLAQRSTRSEMVRQLITYAVMYELDGINIDFENVYYEDRDLLTQFVRELRPEAHAHGLTLSMDVTFISTSLTWSLCYDREALSEIVDYIIVMGYDEHWATSPKAGSVASLPWVESGLRRILEEVPADRLILGIPFYTRVWEEWVEEGQEKIKSQAIGMNTQKEILEERGDDLVWDERAGQHYLEYEEDDRTYRIWIEDEVSLGARLQLVQRYDLAGVAAWRRGFEIPEFWPIIDRAMRHWP